MDPENKRTLEYFDKVIQQIDVHTDETAEMGSYLMSDRIRLSQTDQGARTVARVDAALSGAIFDESETLPEELSTVEDDMIEEMLDREIELIFGE